MFTALQEHYKSIDKLRHAKKEDPKSFIVFRRVYYIPSVIEPITKRPNIIVSKQPVWLFRPPPFVKDSIIKGTVVAQVIVQGFPVVNSKSTLESDYNLNNHKKIVNTCSVSKVAIEDYKPSPPPSPSVSSKRSSVNSMTSSLANYMNNSTNDWRDWGHWRSQEIEWCLSDSDSEYGYLPYSDDSDYESVN